MAIAALMLEDEVHLASGRKGKYKFGEDGGLAFWAGGWR